MLHIFLVILKIIGIILAVILGIILVLLTLILFCPVRYGLSGKLQDGITLQGKVSFLKPLFVLRFEYDTEPVFQIKIFGIPYRLRKKEESNQEENVGTNSDAELSHPESVGSANNENDFHGESESLETPKILKTPEETKALPKHKGRKTKIRYFLQNIKGKINNYFKAFRKIYQSFSSFRHFIGRIIEFWDDEQAHIGLRLSKLEILKILKEVKPQKYYCHINFGTGDPALTGQVLGAFGFLYSIFGKGLLVKPDFEQAVLKVDFECKGRMRGFAFVRLMRKLFFHKDIKYLKERILNLRRTSE